LRGANARYENSLRNKHRWQNHTKPVSSAEQFIITSTYSMPDVVFVTNRDEMLQSRANSLAIIVMRIRNLPDKRKLVSVARVIIGRLLITAGGCRIIA